jgi:hypothetical protein
MSAPFRSFLELHSPAVMATGNTAALLKNTLVVMLIMLTSFYLVTNLSNRPVSLALVWTTVFPALAIYSSRNLCKVMNISFVKVIQPIFIPFMASVVMALVVFVYSRFFSMIMHDSILLISSILLGVLTYSALIFVFDRPLAFELKRLILKSGA